ncbi:oligosaccharide flippase family protein [Paenibacillus sp. VCA1]|uniref:lipopolysaccharide biosynthesis protein n=1 Tax=Paenibacillus sp. VCA1 TaxID=3039148 RepID=UPI0028722762|nr:oligosaccharide flippase family protein [Paenibacillus sp. VCA1]MDR9854407.1 oligosaccharide flippase family protein [Paenibacillus sp. VCA1]
MNIINKKMFSGGIVYLFSSILTQGMNLILIPMYTRNLSQEQYGHYDLIITIQQLLAIIITLGVYSGMIRFYNEFENKIELKNTAMTFSILWGVFCAGAAFLLTPALYPLLFPHVQGGFWIIPLLVMSSVLVCLNMIYSSYFAMGFKALKSGLIQVSTMFLMMLFAFYYFIHLKLGITGILMAQLSGNLAVFLFLFAFDLRTYRPVLVIHKLRKMLRYGTGLLMGDISGWVLTLSDRFLIKGYMNLSSVAVYSIGYKIGMLINPVFVNPFTSVFTPFKYKVYQEEEGSRQIERMFRIYNFLGWFCVLGLSLFAHLAVRLVATDQYSQADLLVPLISLSYFLSGAISFYSLGLHIANKMKTNSLIIILASVINIVANVILIPWLGIYGSALATVISYAVANLVFYHYGSKYYPLGLGWLYPYKYLVIFTPLYGVYFVCKGLFHNMFFEILLNGALCLFFILLSLKFKFIAKEELIGVFTRLRLKKLEKTQVKGVADI